MEEINVKGRSFTIPQDIVQIDLVKYADGYFLPNGYIPSNFINKTYVKKEMNMMFIHFLYYQILIR